MRFSYPPIHYSLFDIRLLVKKHQKQLSAYGALALMAQQHEVVHVIYCQSVIKKNTRQVIPAPPENIEKHPE